MKIGNIIKIVACIVLGYLFLTSLTHSKLIAAVILAVVIVLILFHGSKKAGTKEEPLPTLSKEKEAHYTQLGMSEQEINFFRDTMNTAKKQIVQLQKNMNMSTKLRAIDLRNDTLRVSKALFKELVKEPKKLHLANHFLYTHLPNLVDLTSKYLEINDHEIKNKQTYEKLEESSQVIDQVSKLIKKDYEEFVSDDLEDLDIEISVAKNSLKRDNEPKEDA
ncbi:5-bromo-4-chloroindolyl phosphate hydrolysis protein [Erwinia sp. CPCC 100877]|nr:5-bromo-4-chloroindolyl phosphate hydrolysis protein [Erwinia sp. CPCC 100877]